MKDNLYMFFGCTPDLAQVWSAAESNADCMHPDKNPGPFGSPLVAAFPQLSQTGWIIRE